LQSKLNACASGGRKTKEHERCTMYLIDVREKREGRGYCQHGSDFRNMTITKQGERNN
jgi:hypothetical protein